MDDQAFLDGYMYKKARKEPEKYIAVDLDGTLAKYNGWKGDTHIGPPIAKMVLRIKRWFRQGKKVKIFTARAHKMRTPAKRAIEAWCEKYLGRKLEITNVKDPGMTRLWDDRAMDVKRNDGTQTRFVIKG